jgi:molybdate transport system regulatory protein
MKGKPNTTWIFQPRFRITHGENIAIGPGKACLLRLVKETGSISQAARKMNMSYMRAWTLIRTMNHCFRQPVITASRGGENHGGARLTPTGERLLGLYQLLDTEAMQSTAQTRSAITRLLRHLQK